MFLAAFLVLAALDWMAVGWHRKRLEYFAKPATLLALLGYAALGSGGSTWLLAALAFSLAGDVFLMLPADLFAAGLAAFLVGHLAYVVAFATPVGTLLVWLPVVLVATAPVAIRILRHVHAPGLRTAVAVYMMAIALMAAAAVGSGDVIAIVGALLFVSSDSLLAWNRFVRPFSSAHLAVMVTYHLGQFGLATALR